MVDSGGHARAGRLKVDEEDSADALAMVAGVEASFALATDSQITAAPDAFGGWLVEGAGADIIG